MVRNITFFVGLVTLTVMAIRYKDYHLINHHLLEEIRQQNLEVKMSMEQMQVENRNRFNQSRKSWGDSLDGLGPDILAMLSEDTGYRGDEEEDAYSDSGDSFETTRSDRTFEPEDFNLSPADRSRETTPTPQNDINLAMEVAAPWRKAGSSLVRRALSGLTSTRPGTASGGRRSRSRSRTTCPVNVKI